MTNREKYESKLSSNDIDFEQLEEADRLMKTHQFYSLNKMYRNCNLVTRKEISRCTGFKPFKLFTHMSNKTRMRLITT